MDKQAQDAVDLLQRDVIIPLWCEKWASLGGNPLSAAEIGPVMQMGYKLLALEKQAQSGVRPVIEKAAAALDVHLNQQQKAAAGVRPASELDAIVARLLDHEPYFSAAVALNKTAAELEAAQAQAQTQVAA